MSLLFIHCVAGEPWIFPSKPAYVYLFKVEALQGIVHYLFNILIHRGVGRNFALNSDALFFAHRKAPPSRHPRAYSPSPISVSAETIVDDPRNDGALDKPLCPVGNVKVVEGGGPVVGSTVHAGIGSGAPLYDNSLFENKHSQRFPDRCSAARTVAVIF